MTTGLDVFDTTVQESNLWLKDVMERIGTYDRHRAYSTLRASCTPCVTASDQPMPAISARSFRCCCAASITKAGI